MSGRQVAFVPVGNLALYAETEEGALALVSMLFGLGGEGGYPSSGHLVVERVCFNEDSSRQGWRVSSPKSSGVYLGLKGAVKFVTLGFSILIEERK
jgi:hypothetical protein